MNLSLGIDFAKWLEHRVEYAYQRQNAFLEYLEYLLAEYPRFKSEKEIKITESQYRFEKHLKLYGIEIYWPKKPYQLKVIQKEIIPGALGDWEYAFPGNITLDTSIYVSSPSSLEIHLAEAGASADDWNGVLCKYTGTTNLPQGKIITYYRIGVDTETLVGIFFRNQVAVGSVDSTTIMDNTYVARFMTYKVSGVPQTFEVLLYVNGSEAGSWSTSFDYTFSTDTWYHYSIVWWEDYFIFSRLYLEINGSWTQLGDTLVINNVQWSESSINRCGLYIKNTGAEKNIWFDDTEIWGP